ncbi:hypothetical protein J5J83_13465 [Azoarcus sp. L1K30]|uniref:hypothetical protein n=1 Tax=Azoarcus sp. L1K30 TaxID=2820277 RepID=UPI001B812844|nr:hypothetical protein [Azoarcus sp. L1K30]MBR0567126.1 hypothetical protein [Azoarcus sp. L1K30]
MRNPFPAKAGAGVAFTTIGALAIMATLYWVGAFIFERGLSADALRRLLSQELAYWLPVALLGIPGVLLVGYGRRLVRGESLSLLAWIEILCILLAQGGMVLLVLQ